MKAKGYENKIKEYTESVGTYKPQFEHTIKILAKAMEDYDKAIKDFEESGGELIVEHTNKSGATNITKNPYYLVIEGLRASIIVYFRELGLTPAGLKKINDKEIQGKVKQSKLESVLSDLE